MEKKELRTFLLDILSKIDKELLSDRVIVMLNGNTSYIYIPKVNMFRLIKGGKIGTARY